MRELNPENTEWTKEKVARRMREISDMGFIPIPEGMYRHDTGIVGQLLERSFNVKENNLKTADLGTFDLKGARINKKGYTSSITIFHQTTSEGMSPIEIFNEYSYEEVSCRSDTMKRKLYTRCSSKKPNKRGFLLKVEGDNSVCLYNNGRYLCTWNLLEVGKINQMILALAETNGMTTSRAETFHFTQAYLLSDPIDLQDALEKGWIVIEFSIDQPAADFGKKVPHDRGPHFRATKNNLFNIYRNYESLL